MQTPSVVQSSSTIERKVGSLGNGLRLVTIEMPALHYCELILFIRMGSRFEHVANNGISHFLEHMLFRGNRRFPDYQKMAEHIEDMGGTSNAYTGKTITSLNLHTLPHSLEEALGPLAAHCDGPLFKDIDVERKIIIEELLDEKNEEGDEICPENLTRLLMYPEGDPNALPIIGTPQTIQRITRQEIEDFFTAHVNRENALLCAIGKVTHEDVLEKATRAFAFLPKGSLRPLPPSNQSIIGPQYRFIDNATSKNDLIFSFVTPMEVDPLFYPFLVIKRYLDSGMGSKLYSIICSELGLAYDVQIAIDLQCDGSYLDILIPASGENIPRIAEETLKILRELKEKGFPETDLEKTKRRLMHDMEYALDNASYLAEWLAGGELFGAPMSYEERKEKILAVSGADVHAALEKIFTERNLFCAVVGKEIKQPLTLRL